MEFKSKKLENVYNLIFGKVEESEEPKAENVETSENVEHKFLDATLESGELVQIEPALEVGAAVVVIKDENPEPASDGEHTLLDGTVIETAEGLITNIVEAEAEEVEAKDYEEKEEEMSNDTTETQEQKVKKVVESIIKESHFSKDEVNALLEAQAEKFNKALEAEVEAISKAMFGAFEEFGKEEAEEPKAKPAKFNTKKKKKSWVDNFKG